MADGRFYNFDGDDRDYVSVTTFLGIIAKPFLYGWNAKMEREYIRFLIEDEGYGLAQVLEVLNARPKKKPYGAQLYMKQTSDKGNKIHKAIDYTLKDLKLPKLNKLEQKLYDKWLEWWKAQGYELQGAEQIVRSKKHGYAGTLDFRFLWNMGSKIGDWKTGKNHYEEHTLQNLAYQAALEEETTLRAEGGVLVYIPEDKDIWTVDVPRVTDELIRPVLHALGLWRWANKQPWKENN